jgi:mutator protein MutT
MKEITMNLLYLVKGDQVLLAMKKRGHGAGRYNGVGGKLDPDESVEQCLVRESQEEIGVIPEKFEKMAYITFDLYMKGERVFEHVYLFTSSKWTGKPTESEEVAPRWFDIDKLPFDKMWPNDVHFLQQILEGKKLTGHFKLDKNDLVLSHNIKIVQKL